MIKVLFVCLGNICRSPLAEGVFRELVKEHNLSSKISCDSCGTSSYHIGELPHHLSRLVAQNHGMRLTHKARQLKAQDFTAFQYLIAMDASNMQNAQRIKPTEAGNYGELLLMRKFDNAQSKKAVADPYGGDTADFEECYEILHESCLNFLQFLKEKHNLVS